MCIINTASQIGVLVVGGADGYWVGGTVTSASTSWGLDLSRTSQPPGPTLLPKRFVILITYPCRLVRSPSYRGRNWIPAAARIFSPRPLVDRTAFFLYSWDWTIIIPKTKRSATRWAASSCATTRPQIKLLLKGQLPEMGLLSHESGGRHPPPVHDGQSDHMLILTP